MPLINMDIQLLLGTATADSENRRTMKHQVNFISKTFNFERNKDTSIYFF